MAGAVQISRSHRSRFFVATSRQIPMLPFGTFITTPKYSTSRVLQFDRQTSPTAEKPMSHSPFCPITVTQSQNTPGQAIKVGVGSWTFTPAPQRDEALSQADLGSAEEERFFFQLDTYPYSVGLTHFLG